MKKSLPDHLKVPWTAWDAVLVYILPWIVLPILLIIVMASLEGLVPIFKAFLDGLRSGSVEASFTLVLIDAVAELGLVLLYLKKYKSSWKDIGWRKFSPLHALALLGLMFIIFTVGVFALMSLVSYLLPMFNADQAQTNEFTSQTLAHPSLTLLALVIIPPKKYGLIFGAIVTSILFGFAHLQANVSIYTFVLSLVLCFMYVKLRSIIPGIALHMLNNYLAFIAIGVK